jgi:hypothetical protein
MRPNGAATNAHQFAIPFLTFPYSVCACRGRAVGLETPGRAQGDRERCPMLLEHEHSAQTVIFQQ